MASSHTGYCTVGQVQEVIGSADGQDERVQRAVILASRWVDHKLGTMTQAEEVDYSDPITLVHAARPVGVVSATIQAAVRFYRSPDLVLGVAGGLGDLAVRITSVTIPDAELMLLGHRTTWGIA